MASTSADGQPVGPRKIPAESVSEGSGSSRTGPAASTEDQPTIISRSPPLQASAGAAARPRPSASTLLQPGTRLAHFEIRDYIGGGGMGRVYRATDMGLLRSVALKVLTRESAGDQETVRRFLNEARAAARLNHDNIAQVYYVGEENHLPFIAFEYVDGINIRALIDQRGPLPLAEAVSYSLQVAQALAHVADQRVVHRDIKPSNVLITREGQAKVIDMGLARLENPDDSGSDLTASGVTLGTFDYISPEQARDPRNADVRSDTYSLGCTFFYMLAGRPPFPEGTVLQKLLQHQGDEPPDIRHVRPDLPEEVARVLHKMMAKDPRRRYQDSPRLIEALLSLADLAGVRPPGPGRAIWVAPSEPKISRLRRHAPWMMPVAALIVILLLLDKLFWSPPAAELALGPSISRPLVAAVDPTPGPDRQAAETTGAGSGGTQGPTLSDGHSPPAAEASSETMGPNHPIVEPSQPPSTANHPPQTSDSPSSPQEVDLERPNPWKEFVLRYAARAGLRQEALAGEMLAAGPISLGISVAPGSLLDEAKLAKLSGAGGIAGGIVRSGPTDQPSGASSQRGVLVVDPGGRSKGGFATLGAACASAQSGDVVELAFDGRHKERPLAISNLEITVQAREGFQPVLVFQPDEIDPIKYSRSMFVLGNGGLTLRGVAVELNIPRAIPADGWSLFELAAGTEVRLKACSLTIRNASDRQRAYHPEVAFFRLASASTFSPGMADLSADGARHVVVTLEDCVARGEAVFFRVEQPEPVQLTWQNGLLVTTERLLLANGAKRTPQPGDKIELNLTHLTAVTQAGLLRYVHTEFDPLQLDTEVTCSASILMMSAGPLIEQVGVDDVERSFQRIAWHGEANFFQQLTEFWVVRPRDPMVYSDPLTFDQWSSHWGLDADKAAPRLGQVGWRELPQGQRPLHSHTPQDYALGTAGYPGSNPAIGSAADGRDAGFLAERLPELPPEPVAEEGGDE